MLSQTLVHKSQCISKYLFPLKSFSFEVEFSNLEMIIQKNLKALKRIEVLITSHMKVFLRNEYNSYIHTARNAKVTYTRVAYEKTVTKRKVYKGVFRTRPNIFDKAFLRK